MCFAGFEMPCCPYINDFIPGFVALQLIFLVRWLYHFQFRKELYIATIHDIQIFLALYPSIRSLILGPSFVSTIMHLTRIAFVCAIVSTNIASILALVIRQSETPLPNDAEDQTFLSLDLCQSRCVNGTCNIDGFSPKYRCMTEFGLIDANNGVPRKARRDDNSNTDPTNPDPPFYLTGDGCLQTCTGTCQNSGSVGALWFCNMDPRPPGFSKWSNGGTPSQGGLGDTGSNAGTSSQGGLGATSSDTGSPDDSNQGGGVNASSQIGTRDDNGGIGFGTQEDCSNACPATCAVDPINSRWLCYPLDDAPKSTSDGNGRRSDVDTLGMVSRDSEHVPRDGPSPTSQFATFDDCLNSYCATSCQSSSDWDKMTTTWYCLDVHFDAASSATAFLPSGTVGT